MKEHKKQWKEQAEKGKLESKERVVCVGLVLKHQTVHEKVWVGSNTYRTKTYNTKTI